LSAVHTGIDENIARLWEYFALVREDAENKKIFRLWPMLLVAEDQFQDITKSVYTKIVFRILLYGYTQCVRSLLPLMVMMVYLMVMKIS
jgi:hypothetical protein